MLSSTYSPPVDFLLTLGEDAARAEPWPDYRRYGLNEEHVPELIRLATDQDLFLPMSDSLGVWAPIHAWRALGQLRAVAAVGPLLQLLDELDATDDDWGHEEIPDVLAMIGPEAIPALIEFLGNAGRRDLPRVAVVRALRDIARQFPDVKNECVRAITHQLESYEQNGYELNAFLIHELVELGVVEAADLMEKAFQAGWVDETVRGSWEHVRHDLGLGPPPRKTYRRPISLFDGPFAGTTPDERAEQRKKQKKKAKAKRKRAARARALNRKR